MDRLMDLLLQDAEYICKDIDFSFLNNKKIMITGASGLIGVQFLSSLLYLKKKYNYQMFVMALFNSEPEEWFRELLDEGDFHYMKMDLSDANTVNKLLHCDLIIHAATYGQPMRFMQDETKTISLNTSTTNELLKLVKPNGKFLFISSSEVYSGLEKEEYCENDIGTTTPSHPRACYIESKRCGEAICNSYARSGVDVKIARLCLAYGAGSRLNDTRALNNFVISGLLGMIKLLDGGEAKRTYLYVADAIQMMWNVLLHGQDTTYNVGGKSQTTIREVSEIIGRQLGVSVELGKSSLQGAPNNVCLNMQKYEDEFCKTNYIDMLQGIQNTITWYKGLQGG